MTKTEYLDQARTLNRRINTKLGRYEELKTLAEKATQILTGMPRGGTSGKEDTLAKIIDLSREIDAEIDYLVDLEREISEVIHQVSGEEEEVLELYYLCFNTWSQVADTMNYEVRTVYRLHDSAVEKLVISDDILQQDRY